MPEKDYLGKDQRKVKEDKSKEDKPIKGTYFLQHLIQFNNYLNMFLIEALDEAEIALLKTYVRYLFLLFFKWNIDIEGNKFCNLECRELAHTINNWKKTKMTYKAYWNEWTNLLALKSPTLV